MDMGCVIKVFLAGLCWEAILGQRTPVVRHHQQRSRTLETDLKPNIDDTFHIACVLLEWTTKETFYFPRPPALWHNPRSTLRPKPSNPLPALAQASGKEEEISALGTP